MVWLRRLWREGLPPRSEASLAFALACFVAASGIRLALNLVSQDIIPFSTYYPAILFAALIAGAEAGAIVLSLSVVFGWWAFLPPYFSLAVPTYGQTASILLYIGTSSIIIWGAGNYGRMLRQLNEEEHHRKLLVEELNHRVKNKLATVYAIIGRELRSQPEVWDKVQGRLRALAATDDFIAKSSDQTVALRDLLEMEFRPYGLLRASLTGPDTQVPAKLATTLALIIHELATNAAKYGALSNTEGQIFVSWALSRIQLTLDWVEVGGPAAAPPIRSGFGLTLLKNGLAAYHGEVEPEFGATGFRCKMSLVMPVTEQASSPNPPNSSPQTLPDDSIPDASAG